MAVVPAAAEIPRHLALARELVENTKPGDNEYKLGSEVIRFPGDPGATGYLVRADCSGFLLALFRRARYSTEKQMAFLPTSAKRRRFASEDFLYSIENEKGYRRIDGIANLRPGDLLAHAMLQASDQKDTGTTGHVFLIDSVAKPIEPLDPVVPGTRQFAVVVIDSNEEHLGDDDTRLSHLFRTVKGLGRGTIRLYADSSGQIVGWARTFRNTRRFISYDPRFPSGTRERKAAVGRPAT